jgi:hypothetical protein
MTNKGLLINIIGLILLTGMVIFLYSFTIYEAWVLHSLGGILVLIVFLGVGIATVYEWQSILRHPRQVMLKKENLQAIFAVFTGGVIAYALTHDVGLGPVVAASLVAIIANLVWPSMDIPFYCGAFVGMTSNNLLYHHGEVALASLGAALIYFLTQNVFGGFGGKLGTIALVSTALTGTGLTREFIIRPTPEPRMMVLIILIAALAAPLTYYLNVKRQHGAAMASAVVGLTGGLILPQLFPAQGDTLAVVMICASFAGMSASSRCKEIHHILSAGLTTGIIFIYATPLLGGAGGKLGTIAFGAVLSICGYTQLFKTLSKKDT